MAVDLVILKVDRDDTSIRLNGADFTLRQLDQERIGNIDTRFLSNGRSEEGTTGGPGQYEGTLIFEDLDAGYYEIRETNAPDGYVFNADAAFYIRVTLDKVELLQKDEGTAAKYWPVISETATVALHEQTLTVSNKPGEELPRLVLFPHIPRNRVRLEKRRHRKPAPCLADIHLRGRGLQQHPRCAWLLPGCGRHRPLQRLPGILRL